MPLAFNNDLRLLNIFLQVIIFIKVNLSHTGQVGLSLGTYVGLQMCFRPVKTLDKM